MKWAPPDFFSLRSKVGIANGKSTISKRPDLDDTIELKRGEVIYTVLDNIATTITVYVFFGTWE